MSRDRRYLSIFTGGEEAEEKENRALAIITEGRFALSRHAHITPLGLQIDGVIDESEWEQIGSLLPKVREAGKAYLRAYQWAWLDWLAEGERQWGKLKLVAEAHGLKPRTLYNKLSIVRAVPISRRREHLFLKHYAMVASYTPEEQDYWLEQASANQWSTRRLEYEMDLYYSRVDPTTPLKTSAAKFLRVSLDARKKYTKFARKALMEGQGAKSQISQLIDQEIEELQKLRESLWDKNGTG